MQGKGLKSSSTATLTRAIAFLASQDKEFPISRVLVFLLLARKGKEGCPTKDLIQATGQDPATVSRHLDYLSVKTIRGHKQPLHWVERWTDPIDTRRKNVRLTAQGWEVVRQIETIMD